MKRLGLILFIILLIYFIFLIRQDIIGNLELKKEEERVKVAIQKGEILTQDLKAKLEKLKIDSYIEELARIKLGLVKKGETAYKVIMKND